MTTPRPIKPTSTRCQSAWQPNPGRGSTYRRGKSVQTTGTSSLRAALDDSALRARLASEGGQVLAGTPEDYAAEIDREEKMWGPLVKSLSLKVD